MYVAYGSSISIIEIYACLPSWAMMADMHQAGMCTASRQAVYVRSTWPHYFYGRHAPGWHVHNQQKSSPCTQHMAPLSLWQTCSRLSCAQPADKQSMYVAHGRSITIVWQTCTRLSCAQPADKQSMYVAHGRSITIVWQTCTRLACAQPVDKQSMYAAHNPSISMAGMHQAGVCTASRKAVYVRSAWLLHLYGRHAPAWHVHSQQTSSLCMQHIAALSLWQTCTRLACAQRVDKQSMYVAHGRSITIVWQTCTRLSCAQPADKQSMYVAHGRSICMADMQQAGMHACTYVHSQQICAQPAAVFVLTAWPLHLYGMHQVAPWCHMCAMYMACAQPADK
jgi:hypothetical protein